MEKSDIPTGQPHALHDELLLSVVGAETGTKREGRGGWK